MSNSKMLMTKMSKLVLLMNKLATIAIECKKEMLNHPKVIEYLFHKSISKFTSIKKATKLMQNDYVKNVELGSVDISKIDSYFVLIQDMREKYILAYEQYQKCLAEYKSITKSKMKPEHNLPYTPNISPTFLKISDILDSYKTNHIMKWSFFVKAEANSLAKVTPYNFDLNFEVDFYGSMINKENRMVQFVILFDTNKIDYQDYLKQLYLATMNIHLLRLNSELELKTEIKSFLKKILKTDEYTICNPLPSITFKKKENADIKEKLEIFYENFQPNHIIYLKYYAGKVDDTLNDALDDESDDELDNKLNDISADINIKHLYSDQPPDEACRVSDNFFKSIVRNSS